jgi:type I restriction enzyme S subunit
MKQGWEIKRLGEVLVKTETVDPTKKPNDEFIYLDVSSVNKETKEIENASVLIGKDAPSRARKLVRTNDVIFATVRPTHSRVALITEEYDEQVCSTGYFVLRGKEFIFNQYLFYFLLTDEFNEQMEKLQKGASYPAVTDAEVKSILLRFPKSLPEQQRIVAILDEAFAAIAKAKANAEQNLKNAKELFESYLQGVFENKGEGWEEKTLGEIADVEYGYTDKSTEEGDYRHR